MIAVERAQIGITKFADVDDLSELWRGMFDLLDSMKDEIRVPAGARVMVKVNLALLLGYETGATVDPYLVRCLVEWLQEHREVAEVIVAEADATHLSASVAFRVLGWDQTLAGLPSVRFLNLSEDDRVTVDLQGQHFQRIEMSRTFMEVDYLISFAKLKTHTLQRITGIMKNQWGAWPEKVKWVYHPYLPQVICDLVKVRPPDFCLVDGVIAHEGEGPVHGIPRVMGLIIAGTDSMATDYACARLMGADPTRVPYLQLASRLGLGTEEYEVRGPSIDAVKARFAFRPAWKQAWLSVRERIVGSK